MPLIFSKTSSSSKRRLASVLSLIAALLSAAVIASPIRPATVESLSGVRELIAIGEIALARADLWNSPWAGDGAEWDVLNLQLTYDGDSLLRLSREVLDLNLTPDQRAEVVVLMADYYLANGDCDSGLDLIKYWSNETRESGRYNAIVVARARLNLAKGDGAESIKELKAMLKSSSDPLLNQEAVLLLGDIYEQAGRQREAEQCYARVARASESQYQAVALNRLGGDYRDEPWPAETLVRADPTHDRAELTPASSAPTTRSTGAYAVRIGNFESEILAQSVEWRYRQKGYTTRIGAAVADGLQVFVVDIGRFSSASDAVRFMERLQRQTNDTYFVVSH